MKSGIGIHFFDMLLTFNDRIYAFEIYATILYAVLLFVACM